MATPFSSVYGRFLRKITDARLSSLFSSDPVAAEQRMYGWLESAIPKFSKCKSDLNQRDMETNQFLSDVSESELQILAELMLVEWLEPEVNNILGMNNVIFNDDFRRYSNANMLKEKTDLLTDSLEKVDRSIVSYTFETIDFTKLG